MKAAIIHTGIMSVLFFAASTAVALAGPSHDWQSDHNGNRYGNHGWQSDHHENQNDNNGWQSDHHGHQQNNDGHCRKPSEAPITDGLPFLAFAGGAYGMYALTKYRNKSKKN